MKQEFYFKEHPFIIRNEYKITFLKCYKEKQDTHVVLVRQHMYSNETSVNELNFNELEHYFPEYAYRIIRFFKRPVLTYKDSKL